MSAIKSLITKHDRRISIAVIGLVNSGKSEFIKKILQSDETIFASTDKVGEFEIHMNGNLTFIHWNLKDKIPSTNPLWIRSILNSDVLLYIMDSTDKEKFALNRFLIKKLVDSQIVKQLLILSSKCDLPTSANIEELITELNLIEHDQDKCKCDLFKYSSKTGEGFYPIEEWLNKILFKQQNRIIDYIKIQASVIFFEETGILSETILVSPPNISLLTSLYELKRKVSIFSRSMRAHDLGEEVAEIANYKFVIIKEKNHTIGMLVNNNDSINRTFNIARSILKIVQPYSSNNIDLGKIIRDLYPLDIPY